MQAERTRRWTATEVRALIDAAPLSSPRYELVDGELLVTPSPAMPHQAAVRELLGALREYLRQERIGEVLSSPSDVELESEDLRQPDVFVVPMHEVRRVLQIGNPVRELLLTIEILSPSSGRHDRVTKRAGYQRHVRDYWIVDVDSRVVERWQPGDERPAIVSDSLIWRPDGAATAFELRIPPFFRRVWSEE